MKKCANLVAIALILSVIFMAAPAKAATTTATPDDAADKYGNQLSPNDMQGFTKSTTLPTGTQVTVKIIATGNEKNAVDSLTKKAFDTVSKISDSLNPSNPNSDVSKVNALAGQDVAPVSVAFIDVAKDAKEAVKYTKGSYSFVENGTSSDLKLNEGKLTASLSKSGMKVNFNGIVDGYLADTLTNILSSAGVSNAMVTVGGINRSIGQDVASSWRLMVSDNSAGGYAKLGMSLTFSNAAIATVGNGNRAPVTAKGGATACRGVTLMAPKASIAQAIASSAYILGPQKGLSMIDNIENVRGIIVDGKGNFIK